MTESIIVALIVGVFGIINTILLLRVHKNTNGLVAHLVKHGHDRGVVEGRAQEKARRGRP